MRGQFLAELTEARAAQVKDLAELNKLFTAWTETVFTDQRIRFVHLTCCYS